MRTRWKVLTWLGAITLGTVSGCSLYVARRGGSYPRYALATVATHASATPSAPLVATRDLVVQTDAGAVRGIAIGTAVAYKGIPFARPPVGALRWEPPQPPEPWPGVRDATRYDGSCVQRRSGLIPFFAPMASAYGATVMMDSVTSSEDCLYLNVWMPAASSPEPLPVMVWLHGGSNMVGSGTQSTYDGASLTRRGVIVVTVNYRLGVFGFFSHPELTAASPHHGSGNYGLLDQIAALQWVRRHIARFGGDAANVTLFGESAGAIDAAMLMASPLADGLFRRVISESGPPFGVSATLAQGEAFGSAVGASLTTLRALPATELEPLVAKARQAGADPGGFTVDGWVLPRSAQQAFATGAIRKVDLLVGFNGREFSSFRLAGASAAGAPDAKNNAPGLLTTLDGAARPYFGAWTTPATARYLAKTLVDKDRGIDDAAGDLIAASPIAAMAALTDAAGQRVYAYRFDRTVPGRGADALGAFHSIEVPYVFGALHDPVWRWLPFTRDDEMLSDVLQTYWTNFAKTGDPNAAGLPPWPRFTDAQQEFLLVDRDGTITTQRNMAPFMGRVSVDDLKTRFGAR